MVRSAKQVTHELSPFAMFQGLALPNSETPEVAFARMKKSEENSKRLAELREADQKKQTEEMVREGVALMDSGAVECQAPNTANTARDSRRARTQLTIHGLPSQVLSQLESRRDVSKSRSDSNLQDTKLPPTPVGGATTDQLRTYHNLRRDCPTPC